MRVEPTRCRLAVVLADDEVDRFIEDGFIAIREAFSGTLAAECRAVVWEHLTSRGFLEGRPETWVDHEVRVPCPEGGPFVEAGTAPELWEAYDQLIGEGRWARRRGVGGAVVVRFPSPASVHVGGDGWHIESWYDRDGEWWSTVHSETRGLLRLDPPYAVRDRREAGAVERAILDAIGAGAAGRT